MKDPQQTADELVEKYKKIIAWGKEPSDEIKDFVMNVIVQCAILDMQNTIDANPTKIVGHVNGKDIVESTKDYHQQVLTILKSRL